MDSPGFNTFANIAGRGIGVLAALDTIKSGGLGTYLMNRQRMMGDPGFRASLAGSPFSAGIFGVSGQTGPAPAAPGALPAAGGGGVVQPSDFVGPPPPGVEVAAPGELATPTAYNVPGYMPGQARAWMPNLPPYDPEEALKQQAFASQQQAVTGGTDVQRGLAKTAVGIMPTEAESRAVLGQAAQIQRQAGAGSTVGVKFPGMTVQIGSPYSIAPLGEEEFSTPEQARQAAAAHGPGWTIGPTVHGGWKPVAPPTGPQLLPPPPGGAPGLPPAAGGPVMRGETPTTGGPHATIPNRTNNPGNIKDSAFARSQPGYVGPGPAATDGGNFAVFDSPASGSAAMTNLLRSPSYQGLTVDQALHRWSNRGYGGEVGAQVGIHPDRPMSSLSDAELASLQGGMARREGFTGGTPAPPPPPARAAAPPPPPPPPPPPAGGRGVAYAAEPPPGAQVFTPPAPTFDPNAVVPHTVVSVPEAGGAVGYPSAAPAVPQAPAIPVLKAAAPPAALAPAATEPKPAAVRPEIPVDPATGLPLKGRTQEYQGGRTETYAAPETGDVETTLRLRNAGITDPRLATADQIANYRQQERANTAQKQIDQADISRLERGMSETEAAAERRLALMKGAADRFVTAYPNAADRAQFLGVLKWPWQTALETLGWQGADAIDAFRTKMSPFSAESLTDEKGKPLNPDLASVAILAPSMRDSPAMFEQKLQEFRDTVDDEIAMRSFVRTAPSGSVTPQVYQQKLDELQQARTDRRLAALSPPPAAASEAAPPPPPPPPASTGWAPNWVR